MMNCISMTIKNKSKKGFTLVEMLTTVVIVVLLSLIFAAFINLTSEYFDKTVRDADAQTLSSTLINAVQDELRYATDIKENGDGSYTYFSTSSKLGQGCTLKDVVKNVNGQDRHIIVIDGDRGEYPLINYGSYVYDINAYIESTFSSETGKFDVLITIKDAAENEICKREFAVVPLNPNEINK